MFIDHIFDYYAWLFLQWYYLPYYIAGNEELDKWTTAVTLNGARWSNLCKPN